MKIYAELDNGEKVELREIQGLQPNCEIVFIRTPVRLRDEVIREIEAKMAEKIGKKVVLLDVMFGEVFVM
jgi:hypothetical protein